jgi:hypothetical protein
VEALPALMERRDHSGFLIEHQVHKGAREASLRRGIICIRYMRSQGTFALIDRVSLNHPPPYGRLKKRKKPKPKAPPRPTLAESLARVDGWAVDLAGGLKKSEIARREGLTRARVTQLMKLVHLPDSVKAGVKAGDDAFAGWSIRKAIELVGQGGAA